MSDDSRKLFRVALAEPLSADAEMRLAEAVEIVRPADSPGDAGLAASLSGCDGLIVRTATRVTRELLAAGAPRLRVVGVAGVGIDRVDVEAAHELGIRVLSTPDAASDAVAEFTIGLMLSLLRPVHRLAEQYRCGAFHESRRGPHGMELRGLTVGIIGMGRIGSRVGRICSAGFGARVVYNDIVPVGPFDFTATAVEKSELWRIADIVTLHTPLTPATRELICSSTLGAFKNGSMLVNTARGQIVDTPAVVAALQEGRLAGLALDVTDPEPLPGAHPLLTDPRVILTPHVAARTVAGLAKMFAIADLVVKELCQLAAKPA